MFRDDDISPALASSSPLPNGSYEPAGRWQVRLGNEVGADRAHMVSFHEVAHAYLNSSTSYGAVISALGAIALGSNAGRASLARKRLVDLVNHCRTTHEVLATAWGVWTTKGDSHDLLRPYPDYAAYLAQAIEIAPGWPAGCTAKTLAVLQFARVCMQTRLLEHLLELGTERFMAEPANAEDSPDSRFALLCSAMSAADWARLEMEAKEHFVGRGFVDLFLDTRPNRQQLHTSTQILEELQRWLYSRFASALVGCGVAVLGVEAHHAQCVALREQLSAEGERYLPKVASGEPDLREESRRVFQMFAGERLMLREEHMPATVDDVRARPVPNQLPGGSAPHQFIAVRPLARVFSQYEMSPEARGLLVANSTDEISVAIRTTRIERGRAHIDLRPIVRPSDLLRLAGHLPQVLWLASVSLLALRSSAWSERWLPYLRAIGHLTALIDGSPETLFDEWHDTGVRCVVRPSSLVGGGAYTAGLFACAPERPPDIKHLALCSPATASSLEDFALSSPFSHRSDFWRPESDDDLIVGLTMWHLLNEEPWFDFYANVDAALLRSEEGGHDTASR